MASSVPAALDWLHEHARALEVVRELRAEVSDGWPAARGNHLIAFGVTPEEDDAAISADYAELSREEYEEVQVPSIIIARRTGKNAAAQARKDAFAMLDAIRGLVRADRRMGGAINPGMPARVVRWSMAQTDSARQAGEGRVCEVRWTLGWTHRG